MAKRVFFSFHYQDVIDFRANVVRNHRISKEKAGYFDASIWEDAKKTSDLALKRLINSELKNTSTTCVLVGSDTYERKWVKYEILKSIDKGNYILAIHINGIRGKDQKTKLKGYNPLDYLGIYKNSDSIHYLVEKKGNKWHYYNEIDGNSKISWLYNKNLSKETTTPLSSIFNIYDWINNDGYNNFDNWL